MKIARRFHRACLIAWVLLPCVLQADTFMLRDGRRFEGTAQEDGDVLIITTYSGEVVRVARKDLMGSTSEPARNLFYLKLKALQAGDAPGCFALGQWAAEQKLPAEAKLAYERTLTIDPKHEGARSVLNRATPAANSPPTEGDVLIAPSTQRPEKIELADVRALTKRLADLKDTDDAEMQALLAMAKERPELLARVLKTPARAGEAKTHLRAVQFMAQAGDRRSVDPLLSACFEEPDETVRHAAAKALAQLEEPSALRKLVDVAVTPKFPWPTRQRACETIRYYGDREAVERLLSLLSFELAGGQSRDPKNPLVKSPGGLGSEDPFHVAGDNLPAGPIDDRTLYPVLYAFREVTGATFDKTEKNEKAEKDYRTWQKWWTENQAAFKFPE